VFGGTTTVASGAFLLLATAGSPAAGGGTGRLTTAASRISLVDVIGTTDGVVQADDAIATASSGNKRFMFAAEAPAVNVCHVQKAWHAEGQACNQRIVMLT
jgi:DNA-binding IscR family transcriptional regulator